MTDLIIENDKQFIGQTIQIDGTAFSGCSFTNCQVHYAGGPFGAVDCRWDRGMFHFEGPAARTAALLDAIDFLQHDRPFVLVK